MLPASKQQYVLIQDVLDIINPIRPFTDLCPCIISTSQHFDYIKSVR